MKIRTLSIPVRTAFLGILLTAAIGVSGCSAEKDEAVGLDESFSVNAHICQADFEADAKMQRTEQGWQITMTSPETVEGMQLMLTDEDCRIQYSELTYNVKKSELPDGSPVGLTARVLDKAVKAKDSGTISGMDYELKSKNGKPQELKIGSDITVEFTKYKKS